MMGSFKRDSSAFAIASSSSRCVSTNCCLVLSQAASLVSLIGRQSSSSVSRAAARAMLGYKGHGKAVGDYIGTATNQQAEIVAAAVGLENLKQPCEVSL